MPQNEMIPRDRGDDPAIYERSEETDGPDDDFLDDLTIVLAED
ncbi:hypothetical protein ABH931_004644 [Streptacidiphilus sp. MAP12-33]